MYESERLVILSVPGNFLKLVDPYKHDLTVTCESCFVCFWLADTNWKPTLNGQPCVIEWVAGRNESHDFLGRFKALNFETAAAPVASGSLAA